MTRDLVLGGAALAIAAGYYVLADAIPESLLADTVGPAGLPTSYAWVLGALALVLIARSRRVQRPEPPAPNPESRIPSPESGASRARRAAAMLGIGVVYLLVVEYVGYFVSVALLIAGTAVYQGAGVRQAALVALSGAFVFWLLFAVLLGIPHPAGFWPSLF